jgi:pimeloyl-ACP methyl ester carboxylesterase
MTPNRAHHSADATDPVASALTIHPQVIEAKGRRIASRSIGEGQPLLLCLRRRGVTDGWDPAFLEAWAETCTVITFDSRGLGQSTGTPSDDRAAFARDPKELADALGLDKVVMGGWSLGGGAQVFTARSPERTSHTILIGTVPPGAQLSQAEPIFLPPALQPHATRADEYVLFFEPEAACSRAAGRASYERLAARAGDGSPPLPEEPSLCLVQESHDDTTVFPDHASSADSLASTSIPLLVLSGDHDIVFPVEHWYALNRQWKSLHTMTFPQAGHGPQHPFPEVCADVIARFVRHVRGGYHHHGMHRARTTDGASGMTSRRACKQARHVSPASRKE